jgi:hypothetical protein
MKLLLILSLLTTIVACNKSDDSSKTKEVDLYISDTQSPATVVKGGTIVSRVKCVAPDLCHFFKNFEVAEVGSKEFQIKAKGSYNLNGYLACAQVTYLVDTTLSIPANQAGTYLLRFLYRDAVLKTDTVVVP